jgi:hypothetical protein
MYVHSKEQYLCIDGRFKMATTADQSFNNHKLQIYVHSKEQYLCIDIQFKMATTSDQTWAYNPAMIYLKYC